MFSRRGVIGLLQSIFIPLNEDQNTAACQIISGTFSKAKNVFLGGNNVKNYHHVKNCVGFVLKKKRLILC